MVMVVLHCQRKQTRIARKDIRVIFRKRTFLTLSSTSRLRNSDYTEKITAMRCSR